MTDQTTGQLLITLPDADWQEALAPHLPAGVRSLVWDVDSDPREALGDDADHVAYVVVPYAHPAGALETVGGLPALQLVQALSAGYDNLVESLPEGVRLANGAGIHDASTSELALALALASLRGLDDAVRDAQQGRWRTVQRPSLADRRVLVLGTGGIGGAIADRLGPFEVDLVRVATTARSDERGPVHGIDELPTLLPSVEVVFIGLPLNDTTRGLVDAAFLAALPDGALVVNVGRGPIVDTDALLAELRSERLYAALDVTDPEPLPADHPLWAAPNVLISPHVGGHTTAMRPRALRLLRTQVERLVAGQEPLNVVVG
ncbi:Phosphoglycerate dehydrogenase [Quadrisphaera granulorum]|uniref:Phosphoglycerate dehydrogenase-like enzyme n=1 Tax=Quadrisphaera granulorum TaxID=317664 RepID=A0A316AHC8_9ACTN|nr:2-hydroxyacid dehydrogenase [Quadrisphaera granulorum]PWJ56324.1 phosphoglycerate dehydrogenase-like enzyme [Quadrisphaera granulorum]SZE94958.1 Phosphoglycerate dehydrogenase [Quadrisphaera granulorum]